MVKYRKTHQTILKKYIVDYQNLEKEERAIVDATEKAREDLKATIIYAQKEIREEIAKKMLKKGLTIKLTHEVTGLYVKEIEKLNRREF